MNLGEMSFGRKTLLFAFAGLVLSLGAPHARAADAPAPPPVPASMEIDAADGVKLRLTVVTRGLSHPWALAQLPNGDMLVTERAGRVRLIRKGVLDPTPVAKVDVGASGLSGLRDIVLHPRFAENKFVYLTYNKAGIPGGGLLTLARGRWDGDKLVDIKELFVSDSGRGAARIAFDRDGLLYWAVGGPPGPENAMESQDPMRHTGKILRLRDDGSVAPNNPFAGRPGYKPEIFTLGHRNALGLTLNPFNGQIWQTENGPQGGDEVNIILPGRNYGWPLVSFGRWYDGPRVSLDPYREGMEPPVAFWVPAISPSGMTFYTSDKIPQWKGNLFVGSLQQGRVPQTGHIERIVFNAQWEEIKREPMLMSLRQRIRDIRQAPDGALYVLTDEEEGVLLRIDPIDLTPRAAPGARAPAPPPGER